MTSFELSDSQAERVLDALSRLTALAVAERPESERHLLQAALDTRRPLRVERASDSTLRVLLAGHEVLRVDIEYLLALSEPPPSGQH